MQYLLVKGSADYADEFDCEFFRVVEKERWEKFVAIVEKYFKPFDIYFGTNESLEFKSFEGWKDCFETMEISKEQYHFLDGALCGCYGNFGTGDGAISFDVLDQLDIPEEVADDFFACEYKEHEEFS